MFVCRFFPVLAVSVIMCYTVVLQRVQVGTYWIASKVDVEFVTMVKMRYSVVHYAHFLRISMLVHFFAPIRV